MTAGAAVTTSPVVMATLASATAMGQQAYEEQLFAALPPVLPRVRRVRVRSMRSDLPGERRMPLRLATRPPLPVQWMAARALYGAGLVHRCDLRLPAARAEVVTVHDLAPWRYSDEGQIPSGAARSLSAARAVICPSQFAARELASTFGVEAVVVANGIEADVWTSPETAADHLDVPRRFVLHSGGSTQRKNLNALAAAWPQVRRTMPDVDLVLCGPPSAQRDGLFAEQAGVHRVGRVERSTLLALMSRAEVVVVPSLYEGFGLPALEAMARSTAVVAARCASLPEVCGDAALLCPPSPQGLAEGLLAVLGDVELRRRLAAAGPAQARPFTWERSARAHAEVMRAAMKPPHRGSGNRP